MQFTTWSTLINAFIISTVALLSLIQAANAQASNYGPNHPDVAITSPNGVVPSSYFPGTQIDIGWYLSNQTALIRTDMNAFLKNDDIQYNYILQQLPNVYDYSIAQKTSGPDTVYLHSYVVLPVNEIVPSKAYYIEFSTYFGTFYSADFTIVYR